MNLGFYNFYRRYNNYRSMFETTSAGIGDDLHYPMVYMAKHLKQLGHSVDAINIENLEKF